MKEEKELCLNCKHEKQFHATPKNHNLGTSHCTKDTGNKAYSPCACTEWRSSDRKIVEALP
jgi:hypothetical protein